jgi:serine/threonine-protein kinase
MAPDTPKASPTGPRPSAPAGQPAPSPTYSRSYKIRRRVWTVGRLLVLLAALGLTFGAFFLTAMRVTTRAREVKVPDLRGKSISEASALLARDGLVLKLDSPRMPDAKVPADHVLSQDPAPGGVLRRQRAVRVRVSDGQREALVPAVTGQPERTAELTLEGAHVPILARAEIRSSSYLPGTIVAQDPPAGSRAAGVRLLVNRDDGGQTYVVPDLVGLPYGRVLQVLRSGIFRLSFNGEMIQPSLPAGIIVQQTPQAGSQIRAGELITVWTSR